MSNISPALADIYQFDDAEPNVELEPGPEYKVELFTGEIQPVLLLSTFGEWSIESDFICVWTRAGLKEAYAIPADVVSIRTVEVPGKHVVEADVVDMGEDEDVVDVEPTDVHSGQA